MEFTEIQRHIGNRIRALRKSKGITQERLAEFATLHPTYVSDIECGKVNASIGSFIAIARALDVPLTELVDIPEDAGEVEIRSKISVLFEQLRQLDGKKRTIFFETVKSLITSLNSDT